MSNKKDDATRAETVGSLLRSEAVVRAARRSSPADSALLGDAVRDAIRLQEEVGLDVITDGEVRRVAWAQTPRFVDAFAATAGRGALNWRGATEGRFGAPDSGGRPAGYPAVVRRFATAPRTGEMAAEYSFLARYARSRTKFTMPAPSYHRRYWSPEHSPAAGYSSAEEFLGEIRDYLRAVAHTLVDLGCDYIQLDAPNYGSLCDPDTVAAMRSEGRDVAAELAFDAALDSSLFDGMSGVTSALHVCRGNGPAGAWHSAGGYGAISARLFPRLAADRLLLEYDSDRPGGVGPPGGPPPGPPRCPRPAHHEGAPARVRRRRARQDRGGRRLQAARGTGAVHAVRVRVGADRQPGHARGATRQARAGGAPPPPGVARVRAETSCCYLGRARADLDRPKI